MQLNTTKTAKPNYLQTKLGSSPFINANLISITIENNWYLVEV